MPRKASLVVRIAIGKGLGLLFGMLAFFLLASLTSEVGWSARWGILLWYTTLGAVIGVFGVFAWHPILKIPLPWWVRAPVIGGWMNFVLVLLTGDKPISTIVLVMPIENASPFWLTLEGALVGFVIGLFATQFGGEGKETVNNDEGATRGAW